MRRVPCTLFLNASELEVYLHMEYTLRSHKHLDQQPACPSRGVLERGSPELSLLFGLCTSCSVCSEQSLPLPPKTLHYSSPSSSSVWIYFALMSFHCRWRR